MSDLLNLEFDWQTVAVPAETPFNAVAGLGGPPCHHIFDSTSEDVPIVRQARRKRRAIYVNWRNEQGEETGF